MTIERRAETTRFIMVYTTGQLAKAIKAELIGDAQAIVRRARPFELAGKGDVTYASDPSYLSRVAESEAAAIIVNSRPEVARGTILITANPKLAFARAIQLLHSVEYKSAGVSDDLIVCAGTVLGDDLSIHPRVTIGCDCTIGDKVTIHPGVVIGDRCKVGDETVIYSNVSIYSDCLIGSRVIIHSGAVLGADGFGFIPDEEGRQVKILQLGRIKIEDDCEIGANCAIDRGSFEDTVLNRGVKLDNLIQIGHNSQIGEHTVVAALTGFSGGTKVGRHCVIAGQVGTQQHITIGDRSVVMGKAGVTKSYPEGSYICGVIPARNYREWRKSQALFSRLPEIVERIKKLELILDSRAAEPRNQRNKDAG